MEAQDFDLKVGSIGTRVTSKIAGLGFKYFQGDGVNANFYLADTYF